VVGELSPTFLSVYKGPPRNIPVDIFGDDFERASDKNLGNCLENCSGVGNPIHAGTGNKFQAETDYAAAPHTGLSFTRYYNSQDSKNLANLGFGWRSTWHRQVSNSAPGTLLYMREDGRRIVFTQNTTGAWVSQPDVTLRLSTLADSAGKLSAWRVVREDDSVELYSPDGRLTSIATRSGRVTTLGYDVAGRLIGVTGPFGHRLAFFYDANGRIGQIQGPDGGVFTYGYDGANNLASVRAPDGASRTYHYTAPSLPNALTGITDENGARFASYTYDGPGRAIATEHAGGVSRVAVAYNADKTATVTRPTGARQIYAFNTQHEMVKPVAVSGPPSREAGASAYAYDPNGFVASRTDYNGIVTTFTRDARGLPSAWTEAAGTGSARAFTATWHPTYRLPLTLIEPRRTTQNSYDAKGNLLRRTVLGEGRARSWAYTYNPLGQMLTIDGPRTDVSDRLTFTYHAHGGVATITNAQGHRTQFPDYDANGRLLRMIDPNGLTTTFVYDARGRLIRRDIGGLVTQFEYDAVGQLIKRTDPDSSFRTFAYDAAHRLISIADHLGNRIAYTLDPAGNRIEERVTDAAGTPIRTRANTFDAINRLATTRGQLAGPTEYAYDNNSNLTQVTDPLGFATAFAYDALNRMTSATDPDRQITEMAYDASDNLVSVTDARRNVTEYGYDALGNQTQQRSPDTGNTNRLFNDAGEVVSQTDAHGRLTSTSRDALGRITQQRYAGVTPTTFTYDTGANGIGRRNQMTDAAGTTTWGHDAHGRVTRRSGPGGTVLYGYDAQGRLDRMTYPSGMVVTYAWTADRVTGIAVNGTPILSNIDYFAFGPVKGWTWGNGRPYARTFDADGRLSSYPLGNRTRQLVYDAASRITGYSDSDTARSATFDYDALGRLTGYHPSSGPGDAYRYDAVGNRLGTNTASYSYDSRSNRLTDVSGGPRAGRYTYDATGNIVADGRGAYTFDGRNRLIRAVTAAGTASYTLNGLGQRVGKTVVPAAGSELLGDANRDGRIDAADLRLVSMMVRGLMAIDLAADCTRDGIVTDADVKCVQARIVDARAPPTGGNLTFAYDESGRLLGEYGAGGTPVQETIWLGNLPVAVIAGGVVHYVHADHINTPRAIVNTANAVVWNWEGAPFGDNAPTGSLTYNLRFPGQYFDAETGTHYNYFRDYDPATGRYRQSDPIGLDGGINTYSYVKGDPVSKVDRSGLRCEEGVGCWTTPVEAELADRGDYMAFYQTACMGGDEYACVAKHIAANDYVMGRLANWWLDWSLKQRADDAQGCIIEPIAKENIRIGLAQGYASYLPSSKDKAHQPTAVGVAQLHWDEFAEHGLKPTAFGGTPFGPWFGTIASDLWCPNCE